ncbi:shikimate kinase [Corynebacterium heidelbergense]|uniref:Shikimate kinase n=1 Tax=Corynebacterium heidelbergense TaxID=2055947 RepID=A0A364VBQ4_9CORY|nr:shikimate kinase [Corynebacterium heidelbergense]RAV33165.1 shikimate kinase [Corynebacterium heidelbergense]RAV34083.1 shikimate kinase [Corynebacterium heidelbergense]WCZ36611.1 Shikimate kinase [Corynebacterium heidelbergense]
MSPRVVLIGPPGSGKTTIGTRLAHALDTHVVDSDDLIAQRFDKPCGTVLSDLGEAEFRRVEEEAVEQALATEGVVSLGGGAVLSPATQRRLMDHVVVYLRVSVEEGVRRTAGDNSRPLLNVPDPEATYRRLLDERAELYESAANYRVHSDGKDPQRVVTDILHFIDDVESERRQVMM